MLVTSLQGLRRHIPAHTLLIIPSALHPLGVFTHRQFVVKPFDFDDQAVLAGHQFVLQLGHLSLVGRLCQVVAQDVHQQVEQDHTGGGRNKAGE